MSSFSTICMRCSGRRRYPCVSVRGEGNQGQDPRPLDRLHQLALVLGAGTRDPPRENLGALRREGLEQANVFVVDELDLLIAKLAELLLAEQEFLLVLLLAAAVLSAPARLPRFPHRLSCDPLRAPWAVRSTYRRAPAGASSSGNGRSGARSPPAPAYSERFARSCAAVDPAP